MAKIHLHQKAVILNKEEKFLVLKATYKGLKWDLPGGALEFPELHNASLKREVREEAGLDIENIVPLDIQTAYNQEKDDYIIFIGYKCAALSGAVTVSSEHSEHAWVTKDEFLQLDAAPYLKEFIEKFV
ncbi:MAG: NUDIX domain-containing protein [bacterium]|nr:NUDIX domain-containing protein [bacterium]